MDLRPEDLDEIVRCFANAWSASQPVWEARREDARKLKGRLRKLDPKPASSAIAFVAADGGDNRIRLGHSSDGAPAIVEIIRVVDSDNQIRVQEVIPGAVDGEIFSAAPNHPVVRRLCEHLGCKRVSDLSPYLDASGGDKVSRSRKVQQYRDIVEWAALCDLLHNPREGAVLLVREGTLRSWAFHDPQFKALNRTVRARLKARDNGETLLVGIAKRTALLDNLRLALTLEGVFDGAADEGASYVWVPHDLAEKFYKDRRWLDTQETAEGREYRSMGEMFLVKFGGHPLDPVWPVDIASEHLDMSRESEGDDPGAKRVLEFLAEDARRGFPVPDFPLCIQTAHDSAKIGGIELSWLKDILIDKMEETMKTDIPDSPGRREKIFRALHLGEDLAALRYGDE